MIYFYANTGHKIGLERLRRGVALLKKLESEGKETQLLVNDFRAGLVARDLGVVSYVTIETVQDIDAIADIGNSIIIDSIEDDHGRLVKYCSDFEQVWRFAHDVDDTSVHGEYVIDAKRILVDDNYFQNRKKEKRTIFFLGDADYDKTILTHADFFQRLDMELLLGNYFFVKYEDDLAKIFSTLHEPETYEASIMTSSNIVTSSSQTALEAKASGANVIYVEVFEEALYSTTLLESYGIHIVEGFDSKKITEYLQKKVHTPSKHIEKINLDEIL